jgi:NADPH-dependent curcumin reductase CurA
MLAGSRAVGIAGGVDKCAYVKDELGFDRVIDHRSPAFASELAEACPEGVDVYFENVGGHVWDAVFPLLNTYARVPVCGQIAQYNGPVYSGKDRLPATMSAILRKSLLIRGFINTEFLETHCDAFQTEIGSLVASGSIKYKEDIIDGLENAPRAFIDMLSGGNFGKLLVSVGR